MKTKRYVYEVAKEAKERFKGQDNYEEESNVINGIVRMAEYGLLMPLEAVGAIYENVRNNGWGHME